MDEPPKNQRLATLLNDVAEWADAGAEARFGEIAFRLRLMACELETPASAEPRPARSAPLMRAIAAGR